MSAVTTSAPSRSAENDRRALLLLAAFAGPLLLLGLLLWWVTPVIFVVLAVVAGLGVWAALNADRIALARLGAVPAPAERCARLYNLVEGLCLDAGVPQPRLLLLDSEAPNVMTVGYGPERAAIVVTSGLLDKLNLVELEGVLATQVELIKGHEIRVRTEALVLGEAPWLLWFRGPRALAALTLPVRLLESLSRPAADTLSADEHGALLTRYPPGLINALTKIAEDPARLPAAAVPSASLWLADPAPTAAASGPGWLRARPPHPPLDERIESLREL
jgi:heat shock protein HtpX